MKNKCIFNPILRFSKNIDTCSNSKSFYLEILISVTCQFVQMRFRITVIFWGSGLRPHQWQWSSTKRVSTGIRLFVFSKESCSAFGATCQENQWYFLICFREVTTTVEFRSKELCGVKVLLIHRWPRDVYVDPYQLASLSDQNKWKVRHRATRCSITQCKILLQTTVMYKTCAQCICFI